MKRGRAIALIAIGLACAASMAGCEAGYIARAAYEETRLLWHCRPIAEELANPGLPADVRGKLQTVLAIRQFARDKLGLNVGGAYKTLTSVDQGAIVWVVMAAPRDSLTPYTWWFPIVGDVPYRGYFHKADAEAEAAEMERRGYDTYVRSAVAFSSLGFFDDPLLTNLLRLDRVELAGVIIHESFHRTFFLSSNVTFDESAATWVGSRGTIDFFVATEGEKSRDAIMAREVFDSDMRFAAFLLQEQARLLRLYQSGLSHDEIMRQRAQEFARINADYAKLKPTLSGLERFDLDKEKINNAVLLNYLIYFHDFENFAELERIRRGDTGSTIAAIIALAQSEPEDPFHAIWKATRGANGPPRAQPLQSPGPERRGVKQASAFRLVQATTLPRSLRRNGPRLR